MNRVFAIINFHDNRNVIENIIKKINHDESTIYVFCKKDNEEPLNKKISSLESNKNIFVKIIPDEILNSQSKIKNFVFEYFKNETNDIHARYLHVFEDSIEIFNDMSKFFDSIEEMIVKLGLNSWFNTRCDPCNYVLTKYDPRVKVVIDNEKLKSIYDKTLYWTSHANTMYSIYDLENISLDAMKFDDRFAVPMFYIIKKFSDRRNDANDPFPFMNFYPSIEDEGNLFREGHFKNDHASDISKEEFNKESELFKSLNVDYHPDIPLEPVLDLINDRLLEFERKAK